MARVKQDVKTAAAVEIDRIPDEILNTCGLCSRTLFDKLIQISVKTCAPEKTVCDIFANRYNLNKREEDQVSAKAFKERIQYIHRMNSKDLRAESGPINNESSTSVENDESEDEVHGMQGTDAIKEFVETIVPAAAPLTGSTERNPYEVLIELWRDKQYTSEDAYEVFLTELLGRFNPDDVVQYRRDAGVRLDDLSVIIGKTVRQEAELSPEDVHRVFRSGLETFGGWNTLRTDKAIGAAPPTTEEIDEWDF